MSKKTLLAFVLSFLSITISAKDIYVSTSFHEPATEGLRFIYSRDGIRWDSIQGVFLTPQVGKQRVMRDPSIVRGPDGTYHLVWTSSWRGDRGFGYSSSRDLIHWSEQRLIPTGMDTTTVNTWAPELFYDDEKRQFLVIWASCVPGKFPDYQEEHLNNHRLYYMTTKDFKRFSEARLFYDPDYSDIDATLVKRAKNDYVMQRELPSGKGFADIVLTPRKNVESPAIVLELKYDKDADSAISQIHRKQYPSRIAQYSGELLLVGINYDKKLKTHQCKIERTTN